MSDDEVKKWVRAMLESDESDDFKNYASRLLATDLVRFVWLINEFGRLAKIPKGGRVLDVGCGYGWNAAALSLKFGCTVVANDIRPHITEAIDRCCARLRAQGAPISVETLAGDICTLPLPNDSFDAIISNQAIEHIHDLDEMLRVCKRILKPGCTLVATNDNNARSRAQLAEIQKYWHRRDTDWTFIEELRRQRPIEDRDVEPYSAIRERIVKAANAKLSSDQVSTIVHATAGLTQKEIARVAESYAPGVKLPERPALSWCRNPIDGEFCERQLDPYDLAKQANSHGFVAHARHGFRRKPLNWLNALDLRPVNDLLFQRNSYFILVATKPKA